MNAKPPLLVYLHGFASSPLSHKAQLLRQYMEARGLLSSFRAPLLAFDPQQAIAGLQQLIEDEQENCCITLIGSSLGGYYATILSERYGIKCVLINPAVAPYRLLRPLLGECQNYHSGETFQLTERELNALEALEVPAIQQPQLYRVWLQKGDDTLDYRDALARYQGCRVQLEEGGSHAFDQFERVIPMVLEFAGFQSTT